MGESMGVGRMGTCLPSGIGSVEGSQWKVYGVGMRERGQNILQGWAVMCPRGREVHVVVTRRYRVGRLVALELVIP